MIKDSYGFHLYYAVAVQSSAFSFLVESRHNLYHWLPIVAEKSFPSLVTTKETNVRRKEIR